LLLFDLRPPVAYSCHSRQITLLVDESGNIAIPTRISILIESF